MNRVNELIKEYCPDGVEIRCLEDCCNLLDKKRKPITKAAREAGEYPYYGANGIQDYVANYIFDAIKDDLKKNYITITEVGIKDIILPGDMRDIMNTVLIATKKAQANVITRREEVASTRSLLNTAKLMEDNPTLYKLKEMEFIEKISDKIGSINVTGSGDIVSQLTSLLKK